MILNASYNNYVLTKNRNLNLRFFYPYLRIRYFLMKEKYEICYMCLGGVYNRLQSVDQRILSYPMDLVLATCHRVCVVLHLHRGQGGREDVVGGAKTRLAGSL